MTTADIMLAQSGNTESFRDHEYDARTILWALLAAIVIHLAVAFLLAAFSGVFSPTVPFEEKPAELTLMDLSPASLVPKNSAFIETDESKKAPEPKEKTFESNANSIGASELAAASLTVPEESWRACATNKNTLALGGSYCSEAAIPNLTCSSESCCSSSSMSSA